MFVLLIKLSRLNVMKLWSKVVKDYNFMYKLLENVFKKMFINKLIKFFDIKFVYFEIEN